MSPQPIDNDNQLNECLAAISESEWITLDTEFMRERTYYPQLCLVQIGDGRQAWCIDTMAAIDLQPLMQQLCQGNHWRVLHAARQDLEIFFHLFGSFSSPLFDTQIGAGLIGLDAQIGYAGLVKELLGTELEKGYQRANWARRPLPVEQIDYALDDVRFLAKAYPALTERLDQLGRLQWVIDDSARLNNRDLYVTDPANAYLRIGQLRTLAPTEQHIVRELARWREQLAQATDKPRNWISSDNTLIYLAKIKPNSIGRLEKVKGISAELIERESDALLEAIELGRHEAGDQLMSHPVPLSDSEQKTYKKMKRELDTCAEDLGVQAPAIGTRKDVERILRGDDASPLMQGWRRDLIGETLKAMR